ncbi:MAG: penicillin-binding protein 2 [Armatimonadetes bacterium]|nr:penicillin-binding protein 2 [Armatimonadota bacterium]
MLSQFKDRKLQLSRINQLMAVIGVVFLIMLGRLWYLQIAQGQSLLEQSEANRIKLLRTRAPRGAILDCKGRVLATSRPQFVVMAIPDELSANSEALHTLCGILQLQPEELQDIFKTSKVRPSSPVRVAVNVPMEIVARIGELRMRLPGVSVELDQIRFYPDGPAVAHIMGKLGEIGREELDRAQAAAKDYRPGDYVGKTGLEEQYEELLRGTDGGKQIEVNAFGSVVRILGEKESVPGKTLKLSIDRDLQVAGLRALGNQKGAVIAIDPQTGAVLAMVSAPAYNPNVFVKKVKIADWRAINSDPGNPQQNRCVGNSYPPGSTFKPIHAIAGLINGQCDFTLACPGSRKVGRRSFRCWRTHGRGINFNRAIAESCDVWFYELGFRLGVDKIAKTAREFGIGSKTGIDLPDERMGFMPDTAWKHRVYQERWYKGETPSVSIGQGAVLASPLQMALAISGIANGGRIYRPHLLAEAYQSTNLKAILKEMHPELKSTVNARPEDFERVRQAMRLAVTQGTGRGCNIPDVTVCGKTGSAENSGIAHAWFVCFAPMDNPKIAVVCIVEHGAHGAKVAAPVCRALLDVYFGKKKVNQIGVGKVSVSGD